MAPAGPQTIQKKWFEVDKLEQESFPTSRDYHIVIQREAIPIIFVPGIMGSRLYSSSKGGTLVWDPDDADLMKNTFLGMGGLGEKSPQDRLKLLVGPQFQSSYLNVAGTQDGNRLVFPGKFSDAMQQRIVQSNSPYWDWARRDQRVSEDLSGGKQTPRLPWEKSAQPLSNDTLGTFAGNQHEAQLAVTNGWAGISWNFYGDLLERLSEHQWDEFQKCFYFPVYAFGYNWTDSNEVSGAKLNDFINKVIPHERTREGTSNLCNYCIVVTHSMGGLVARWASEKAGAKNTILGIIHGAQPVTGTPSAYHQFRAGEDAQSFWGPLLHGKAPTDWGMSRVIGADAKHIDPIFGHCPGPLQLLPNAEYRTDVDNPKHPSSANWLFEKNEQGKVIQQLPGGDPYKTIYTKLTPFLSFGSDADNVLPDTGGSTQGGVVKSSPLSRPRSATDVMLANMGAAADFHNQLHLLCHPNTFYGYGVALSTKTYDEISYSWKRNYIEPQVVPGGEVPMVVTDPGDPDLGHGVDFDKSQNAFFSIDPMNASGDGTVAASSSTALGAPGSFSHDKSTHYPEMGSTRNDSVIRALPVSNVAHSDFYTRDEAVNFVINSVQELAQNYLCKKIGRTQKLAPLRLPPF